MASGGRLADASEQQRGRQHGHPRVSAGGRAGRGHPRERTGSFGRLAGSFDERSGRARAAGATRKVQKLICVLLQAMESLAADSIEELQNLKAFLIKYETGMYKLEF
ncbi:hypothetical protein M5K25_004125 [Dendrobium thyrsiflorum]|uniref:Uncharacterized protein n=1 Tax=Dendrobium thyrsiflorum TaxID=117978 RepID=A0ABD0VL18_DENTH